MDKQIIYQIADQLDISPNEAEKIYSKAEAGGEMVALAPADWFNLRFLPNLVWIDERGYAQMCTDALKIVNRAAATDYGSSRQRDLGQLWGDMTRGYLAEYAFVLYLEKVWGISAELGHEQGKLDDYLATDIHTIRHAGSPTTRPPKINVSIKGTKWNGIWLDIPGGQFHHSDVHTLIKVGISRDHLFAYFKHISAFRDKILKIGVEVGALSSAEADQIFALLPEFKRIPAYICGFAARHRKYEPLPYEGKVGRKHFTITGWNGEIKSGDLDFIAKAEKIPNGGQVKFEGIGRFSHDSGYLFNTGSLLWSKDDWKQHVIDKI